MSDRFPTTRWSVILAAREGDDLETRRALEALCKAYWFPLYAYVRRRGEDPQTAQDLVQGYFAELIERGSLRNVRPQKGRFRAFVLHTVKHFLVNESLRAAALKRGGGAIVTPLDAARTEERFSRSIVDLRTPESEYERQWALNVVDRALQRLARDAEKNARGEEFARLRVFLTDGGERGSYRDVAAELAMSPGTVRVAVHRLRRRFGQFLREEIADTVNDPTEIDDELRSLFAALRG